MRKTASTSRHIQPSRWTKVAAVVVFIFISLGLLGMVRLHLISSARAQIAAESIYSKSQKDAVFHLLRYIASAQESEYQEYQKRMALPLAGRSAREELSKHDLDTAAALRLLIEAGSDEEDAKDIIFSMQTSRMLRFQMDLTAIWVAADRQIMILDAEARRLHSAQYAGPADAMDMQQAQSRIERINLDLSDIENRLAENLNLAARKAQQAMIVASWCIGAVFVLAGAFAVRSGWKRNEKLAQALRVSEERLRLAMSGSNDGLWDWDIVTDNLYYSQRLLELLEKSGNELGRDSSLFLQFVHPDDLPGVREKLMDHLREDVSYDVEFRIITAAGKLRWVRSRAQSARDASGRALRMAGSITDITARKLSEEMLYAEKERAQVTLESIGDAVVTTDVDGIVEYLNPAAAHLTGWSLDEAKGKPSGEVCRLIEELSRNAVGDAIPHPGAKHHKPTVEINLLLAGRDGHEVAVNRSVAQILDREDHHIGNVIVLHDVSKDRAYATHLSFQANHDELTGLINRREFERRVSMLLGETSKLKQHSMLYIDLDQFKIVNDTSGHLAGDELLKQLSELLKSKLRLNDTLARLGGDEFGVLLEACPLAPALKIAELLRQTVSDFRFIWKDRIFPIGASVGLVTFGEQPATLADILRMADAACYQAKDNGRNRIHVFSAEDKELAQRQGEMGWIGRISQALQEDRFVLYAQKIQPLDHDADGSVHYEILLRMLDENNHIVSPVAFIPAAERYGLMPALDRWVIRNAFALFMARAKSGAGPELCAINLSGTSIGDVDFLPFVREQFLLSQVPPERICFEITETSAIANLGKAEVLIRKLKDLGCRISLDDFGSGMSSFSYLKHLPVDYLKIDGSFVKDMMIDPIDHAMVEAINRIGHVMQIKTIAEFVESSETRDALIGMGVNFAQGYAIGKPAPLIGFGELMGSVNASGGIF